MRSPSLAWLVFLGLTACAASAGPPPHDPTPPDPHTDTDTDTDTDADPDTVSDPALPCPLGRIATAVHAAIVASREDESLVPHDRALTLHNAADPALVDGPEIFPALADLIATARRDVDVSTYVWEVGSDPSDTVLEGLVRLEARLRAEGVPEQPVRARLLVYANRLSGPSEIAEPLVRAVDALGLDRRYVQVAVATRESWGLGAMHQKLAIVDGEVAHLGGANLEHVHGWEDGRVPWHDTAYVVHGEVAHGLLPAFDTMWAEGRTWTCDADGCTARLNERPERPPEPTWRETTCIPMIALTRRPRGEINDDVDNPQDQGYLAAVGAAEDILRIESPNLNDDAAKAAIRDAVGRGVEVRIVLSLGFNELAESLPGQGGPNGENVDALYAWAFDSLGEQEACRRLRIRWYSRDGEAPIDGNGEGASHTKYMSMDGELVIVGSANMDTQTWNHSGEVNIAVDDPDVTADWDARIFDADFARAIPTSHCTG